MYVSIESLEKASDDDIWSACFTKNATNLIVTGGLDEVVIIRDAHDLSKKDEYKHLMALVSVSTDSAGKYIVSSSMDQHVIVYDIELKKIIHNFNTGENTWRAAISPDGTKIAVGTSHSSILLYDVESGNKIKELTAVKTNKYVLGVDFSKDSKQVVCSTIDGSVFLFDVETGQTIIKQLEVHSRPIRYVSFSPDASLYATASDDGQIKVFDAKYGTHVVTFSGHSSWVLGVAFNKDGTTLASCGSDKTVKIWDMTTKECVHNFDDHSDEIWAVDFNEAGDKLLSVGADCRLQMYKNQ